MGVEIWRDLGRTVRADRLGDAAPSEWRDGNGYRMSPKYNVPRLSILIGRRPKFRPKQTEVVRIVVRIARSRGCTCDVLIVGDGQRGKLIYYNFIFYMDLPCGNTSTSRRRTSSKEIGAKASENCATPSGRKPTGLPACISQPDLEPESRRFQSRRRTRIPGREVVATGSASSGGGILIDPGARLYRMGPRGLREY